MNVKRALRNCPAVAFAVALHTALFPFSTHADEKADAWNAIAEGYRGFNGKPTKTVEDTATIIDGDTLTVGGITMDLWGLDAPEPKQQCAIDGTLWPCGRRATEVLAALAKGKVSCAYRPIEKGGRTVAVCRDADGNSLNEEMIVQGMAMPRARESYDYVDLSVDTRYLGRGMWAGTFISPWLWRQGARLPGETD